MVKIEISNRTMYFLVTFGVIALFAVGVFAVTPNPGHDASEVDGVCKSNGADCATPTGLQENLELYIDPVTEKLCYPSSTSSSCTLQSATCTKSVIKFVSSNSCSGSIANAICSAACQGSVACDGDSTSASCGTSTKAYYNFDGIVGCSGPAGDNILECGCSVSGEIYQDEIPSGARCISDDTSLTMTSEVSTTFQHALNCRSLGTHDLCVLSYCEFKQIDDDRARCYVTGSPGNPWSVCSEATNDADAKAQAKAICVDF